ncbi:hypothetical protein [Micromonospora sp. DT233]|uniref:hypothetical protein n=1 Tax=Micromonospora sp. DT233 TaxID=3393432 RepID=UPI003CEB20DA
MTRMIEDIDAGGVAMVANIVLRSHATGQRCWRCKPDGTCTEIEWAKGILSLAEADWAALQRHVATW